MPQPMHSPTWMGCSIIQGNGGRGSDGLAAGGTGDPSVLKSVYRLGREDGRRALFPRLGMPGRMVTVTDQSPSPRAPQGQSVLVIDKNVGNLTRIADRHYIIERGRTVWSGTSGRLSDPQPATPVHVVPPSVLFHGRCQVPA